MLSYYCLYFLLCKVIHLRGKFLEKWSYRVIHSVSKSSNWLPRRIRLRRRSPSSDIHCRKWVCLEFQFYLIFSTQFPSLLEQHRLQRAAGRRRRLSTSRHRCSISSHRSYSNHLSPEWSQTADTVDWRRSREIFQRVQRQSSDHPGCIVLAGSGHGNEIVIIISRRSASSTVRCRQSRLTRITSRICWHWSAR